jgi:hypothetical protein
MSIVESREIKELQTLIRKKKADPEEVYQELMQLMDRFASGNLGLLDTLPQFIRIYQAHRYVSAAHSRSGKKLDKIAALEKEAEKLKQKREAIITDPGKQAEALAIKATLNAKLNEIDARLRAEMNLTPTFTKEANTFKEIHNDIKAKISAVEKNHKKFGRRFKWGQRGIRTLLLVLFFILAWRLDIAADSLKDLLNEYHLGWLDRYRSLVVIALFFGVDFFFLDHWKELLTGWLERMYLKRIFNYFNSRYERYTRGFEKIANAFDMTSQQVMDILIKL